MLCVRVTFSYDIALPSGKTAALIPRNDDPLYVLAVASFLSFSLRLSFYLSLFFYVFSILSCSLVAYNDEIDTWYRETLPSVIFSPTRESSVLYFHNRAMSEKTETEIFPWWKYSRLSIISSSIRFYSVSAVDFAYIASYIDFSCKTFSSLKNKINSLYFHRNLWIWFTDLLCRSISRYSILMH